MIVGIDEVGRGPWAGPLVFGAVVLGDTAIDGLTDSKKLTKHHRETLAQQIHQHARAVGIGWVEADELDSLGLSRALSVACQRALEAISIPYQQIIIDGTVNFLKDTGKGPYVTTIKQADLLVPSVSAASIVAKVARDTYMSEQDEKYPEYGFSSHAGYGTAAHRSAIESYGLTPLHRRSFAPIVAIEATYTSPLSVSTNHRLSTKIIGDAAEDAAATYLLAHGYSIVARNWKTKACEIDIVARKDERVFFVEVKYRRTATQGGGIAAVTPKKLQQMQRAAMIWLQKYGNQNAALAVLEVAGEKYEVTAFIEQV